MIYILLDHRKRPPYRSVLRPAGFNMIWKGWCTIANELTLSGSLQYADAEDADESVSVAELLASVSALKFIHAKQAIGTSEEAIGLGEVTTPGWAIFINRDSTNFIELRVATNGAKFAKLKPGEFAIMRLGSGAQAPYAIADTAPCQLEYFIAIT